MASQAKPEGEGVPVPQAIEIKATWGPTDTIDTNFADQLLLSKVSQAYFHLTFGQVQLPQIGPPKEGQASIRPLVTLVVPREFMEKMIKVLQVALT
jgi:hypothetical protein